MKNKVQKKGKNKFSRWTLFPLEKVVLKYDKSSLMSVHQRKQQFLHCSSTAVYRYTQKGNVQP